MHALYAPPARLIVEERSELFQIEAGVASVSCPYLIRKHIRLQGPFINSTSMPPRKSDPARRSDTTTASFVLVEDVEATETLALPASSSARIPTAAAAASSTLAAMMEVDRPSESAPPTDKERKESRDSVTIEDLTLPKSIITRLAKGVLPPNTQIQTNAVLAMSKSATVFINHLANAANEHTQNANKKTIMPNDVFAALEDIEFPFLRERLEAEFKKFNEVQTTKRNTYRRKVAAAKAGKSAPAPATTADTTATGPNAGDPNASTLSAAAGEPAAVARSAKKQKTNGPDDSRMDVDGGANDEERDASDPETEPEQEHDDDDEDDDGPEEDEDDDDEDEDRNGREMREDALEERDAKDNDRDEALDDGDSD
ncbi:hypothetical protein DL770_007633 [Monosporascus sp. CRB-9-2]|nr:hypothetical protein DL770_007633 [Monosporascus sp. CRB-9-2]